MKRRRTIGVMDSEETSTFPTASMAQGTCTHRACQTVRNHCLAEPISTGFGHRMFMQSPESQCDSAK
jgi:hypothetical protein